MFDIRYVTEADKAFWFTQDRHMSEGELFRKIRDRGSLFLDGTPLEQPQELILIKVL